MAGQIMSGFGYRGGVHFRARAFALGLGVQQVVAGMWEVTRDGVTLSGPLDTNEVHEWLDTYEASA